LFSNTSYPTTPTLSVDVDHERSISEEETGIAESPTGTVGATVSGPRDGDDVAAFVVVEVVEVAADDVTAGGAGGGDGRVFNCTDADSGEYLPP
jgi:hypothetical protein